MRIFMPMPLQTSVPHAEVLSNVHAATVSNRTCLWCRSRAEIKCALLACQEATTLIQATECGECGRYV
ncbi:hypothetical protein WJX77_006882 [Trebouxia sp. C0004]